MQRNGTNCFLSIYVPQYIQSDSFCTAETHGGRRSQAILQGFQSLPSQSCASQWHHAIHCRQSDSPVEQEQLSTDPGVDVCRSDLLLFLCCNHASLFDQPSSPSSLCEMVPSMGSKMFCRLDCGGCVSAQNFILECSHAILFSIHLTIVPHSLGQVACFDCSASSEWSTACDSFVRLALSPPFAVHLCSSIITDATF